ncbi:sugar ABC transporter permease [Streptosporangiaceae bacterium NEAU-GS5]|nr:sugar ABC transporter permease [Streptosporangiaceae bacterium NEAU-GS5]
MQPFPQPQPDQPRPVSPQPPPPSGGGSGAGRVVVALALLLPALLALYWSYLGPTIWTVRTSFQDVNLVSGTARSVGTSNYSAIGTRAFHDFAFALSFCLLPLLTFLIAAPLLAFAAHLAGQASRWVIRIAFAVPMVVGVASTALAVSWRLDLFDPNGDARRLISDPVTAPGALLGAAWGTTFGLVCGVGVTLYLAALRRREPGRPIWPGLLVVTGLGVIAAPAIAVQEFVFPFVVTNGGPNRSTMTPMLDMFDFGFRILRPGAGAAVSTIVLLVLALLGVVATLVIILSGLRVEFDPTARSADETPVWSSGRSIALILGGLGLIIVMFFAWRGIWPALSRSISGSGGDLPAAASSGTIALNTWGPTLISAIIGVGLAALAGFAIGALRPLGRLSELLLLPFAPWLFVGIGPLALAKWQSAQQAERLNTFFGLIPPVAIAIPALFVFTLFFRGQQRRSQELVAQGVAPGDAFVRTLIPGLPLLALLGGLTWLVQAQDLTWPLLVGSEPDRLTGPVALLLSSEQLAVSSQAPVNLALPATVVVLAALALALAQGFYLDRIAIRAGRR